MIMYLLEFLISRIGELLYAFGAFIGCLLFFVFAADLIYYVLVACRVVEWDPENSPFRPLPIERRLQSVGCAIAGSPIFVTTLFLSWCALNIAYTWWWLLPYTAYCLFDKTHVQGRASSRLRSSFIYHYCAEYFPASLIKWHEDTKFPADKSYLFGYHPHGILGCGVVACFASEGAHVSKVFPDLDIAPCTLNIIFSTPILREWALAMGFIGVGRDALDHVLKQGKGKSALVVVGGAQEALQSAPNGHDLVLLKRKGFFRVALNHGCGLVPVYAFGENNVYDIVKPTTFLARISEVTREYFGFSVPNFQGRGIFQKKFGILPARHPINVVVGDPIDCPKIEDPTDEQIDEIQKKYCDALMKMFDEMKVKYVNDPEKEKLRFVL